MQVPVNDQDTSIQEKGHRAGLIMALGKIKQGLYDCVAYAAHAKVLYGNPAQTQVESNVYNVRSHLATKKQGGEGRFLPYTSLSPSFIGHQL